MNYSNICTTKNDDDDVKREDASFRYVRKIETLALMCNTIFIARKKTMKEIANEMPWH